MFYIVYNYNIVVYTKPNHTVCTVIVVLWLSKMCVYCTMSVVFRGRSPMNTIITHEVHVWYIIHI